MSNKTTNWLIIGTVLIVIGAVMFMCVMTTLKWDFTKLSTVKYSTNSYVFEDDFKNITISTSTADIAFFPSEDGKTYVECHEADNLKHNVTIENGSLSVILRDTREWQDHIGINFDSAYINVYLPDCDYGKLEIDSNTGDTTLPDGFVFESINISESTGDVKVSALTSGTIKIKTSTGNIDVENTDSSSVELSVSTGKITVDNVNANGDFKVKVSTGKAIFNNTQCNNFISSGGTGDIYLTNVIVSKNISVERSTGDVKFDNCDASAIFVKTDTGNVTGSLLTDKVFIPLSDTGEVNVPKTVTGGKCEVITDTGNIIFTVK